MYYMRLKALIILLLSIFCTYRSVGQSQGDLTQSRILILLDESSSMIESWAGGMEKYKAADSLILHLMDSVYAVNPDVEFSLRVFGHQYTVQENNCTDTKNEVPFSKDNRTQMAFRLADIRPLGVTPIAYSLQQAAEYDLVDEAKNAYSIILITDGGESCGGDLCEVMRKLIQSKVYFKPYIVSLEDYAPLRATYSCMGDYLQVTKKADIATAVSTIVSAFRPILKITKIDYKQLQTIAASAPSILKVSIPVTVTIDSAKSQPKPVETEVLTPVKTFPDPTVPKPVVITKPEKHDTLVVMPAPVVKPAPKHDTVAATKPVIKKEPVIAKAKTPDTVATTKPVHHIIVGEEPPRPAARKIARLDPAPLKTFNVAPSPVKKPKLAEVNVPLPPVVSDSVIVLHTFAKLKPAKLKKFNVLFIVEDHVFTPRRVPPLPPVNYDAIAIKVDSKIPIPRKAPVPPGKRGGYTVETEDAKETTLSVYFTDGMGKFYNTTPQMIVVEPMSKKIIKKFFRMVDASGEPDPQTNIPVGTYDIAVAGSRSLIIHDVEIVKDKKNKLIITIKKSSLKFAYENAPKRPVSEFSAVVTERNKTSGKVVSQKCTEELLYDPANYHLVINTFPPTVRNVDLDLDDETVIGIPQPGFAKFTGDGRTKMASLYLKDGDKFLPFATVNLDDTGSQHLQIQPGEYQAHFHKGPGNSPLNVKVIPFKIEATKETEVILK